MVCMWRTNDKISSRSERRAFTLVELVVGLTLSMIIFAGILSGFIFLGRNLNRLVIAQDQDAKSRKALSIFTRDLSSAVQISEATPDKIVVVIPGTPATGIRTGRVDSFSGNTLNSLGASWTGNLNDPAAPWDVRFTSGRASGQQLRIAGNTSTSLTLTDVDPATGAVKNADLAAFGLVAGADTFELLSTVTYSYVPPSGSSAGQLTRTDGISSAVLFTNLSNFAFNYYNQAGALLSLATTAELDLGKSGLASVKAVELSFTSASGNAAAGTRTAFDGRSPRLVLRNRALLQ
jgi:hypothetical protein